MSAKKPRGRPSWVTGTKLTFLGQYSDDWQKGIDMGPTQAGIFYDRVTKRFIKRFGWYFDRWSDPEDDPDIDDATLDDEDSQDGLSTEELENRNKYFHELRDAILSWYHNYNGKVTKDDNGELEQMLLDLSGETLKPPRSKRITQYYSKLYYNTRIKAAFDSAWALERAKPDGAGKKSLIAIRNLVTEQAWEAEPESFRTWLTEQRDDGHKKDLAAFKQNLEESKRVPDSAESYHAALSNAAGLLQPFADIMANKFGAAVSILMVCPIGSKGGEIELRSVHSGVTRDLVPLTWPAFDRTGFDDVQRSMVHFGNHVFSTGDRESRALHGARELTPPSNEIPTASTSASTLSNSPSPPPSRATSPIAVPAMAVPLPPAPVAPVPAPVPAPTAPAPAAPAPAAPVPAPTTPVPAPATPVPAPATPTVPVPASAAPIPALAAPTPAPIPTLAAAVHPPTTHVPLATPSPLPYDTAFADEMPSHSKVAYQAVLKDLTTWGPLWLQCVAAFVEFEKASGFPEKDTRLPSSAARPIEVKQWFSSSRKTSGPVWVGLGTGDAEDFGRRWWAWWFDIQPQSRTHDESGKLSQTLDGIDCSSLRKAGGSGIHLVLVCLVWWREKLGAAADKDWLKAVADVAFILGHLKDGCGVPQGELVQRKAAKKRKRTPEAEDVSPVVGRRVKRKSWKLTQK